MDHQYLRLEDLRDNRIRLVTLDRVVDGDSIDFYIDQGFDQGFEERVRLYHVNTPEKVGTEAEAGKWVRDKVITWMAGDTKFWLHSINFDRDRYGRVLGDIYNISGECLNAWLLTNCYGWPTDERGKIIGPRDINRLKLPTGIISQVIIRQRD